MTEDKLQTISIRLPEETYEKLKNYSDSHGTNVSDIIRDLIDLLLAGNVPSPAPQPMPQPAPNIPGEILGLSGRVNTLEDQERKMTRYMTDVAWRINEVEAVLNRVSMLLSPYMMPPPQMLPQFPAPDWRVYGAGGKAEGPEVDGAGEDPTGKMS